MRRFLGASGFFYCRFSNLTKVLSIASLAFLGFVKPASAVISPATTGTSYSSLCQSAADHMYVSTSGNDSNSGTSSAPLRTIQRALNLAQAGTTIHVASGTYSENINSTIAGTSSARICVKSESKWGAKIVGSALFIWTNAANYLDIVGFDITSPVSTSRIGILNNASYVRMMHNHIHNIQALNTGSDAGGGIDNGNYNALDNETWFNVIHHIGNLTNLGYGTHGIYHAHKGGKIIGNIIYQSEAYGIHLWHAPSDVQISNNTVFNNQFGMVVGAGDAPGGVTASNCLVTNNIFMNNKGYGIYETGLTSNNKYYSNLVYQNGPTNVYLQNGIISGTITADPKFLNYTADGSGDYHLSSTSPAIDNGYAPYSPTLDIDGAVRPSGASIDIGAYEYASSSPTPAPAPHLTISATEVAPGGTITVNLSGMGSNTSEWVALYRAADADSAWSYNGNWMYMNGTQTLPASPIASASLKFTAPQEAGTYNIRVFGSAGYDQRVALSSNITVKVLPSLQISSVSVAPGEAFTVTVSGGGSSTQEYVALYRAADADSAYSYQGNWMFLNGTQTAATAPISSATLKFVAPQEAGTYNLRFFGSADAGNRLAVSSNFQVVAAADTTAPSAKVTSPANGSTVPRGTIVRIAASASDNVGVTKLEFYVNGNLKCSSTASSSTCDFQVSNRRGISYNLKAKAYDAAGNVGTSTVVSIQTK